MLFSSMEFLFLFFPITLGDKKSTGAYSDAPVEKRDRINQQVSCPASGASRS